jgi:hypothetical protein
MIQDYSDVIEVEVKPKQPKKKRRKKKQRK